MTALDLDFVEPFDAGSTLRILAAHAIPGLEEVDLATGTYTRLLRAPSGVVRTELSMTGDRISAKVDTEATQDLEFVKAKVQVLLDLDADPAVISAALGADPIVGPLVAARPGLRVIGYPDFYEALVLTVLGQQVSLAAARTFGGRLVAAFGTSGPSNLRIFPSAEVLATISVDELREAVGLTGARANTVLSVAEACADGLFVDAQDVADVRAKLLALKGIGPWTADYLTVRALGDRDGFAPGDLVLRRALGVKTEREAAAIAEVWSPYRAYALLHLWTEAAYG